MIELADVERNSVVLDVAAGSGLLTWEAVRRTPDGQVWAAVENDADAEALRDAAARLEEIRRPVVLVTAVDDVAGTLESQAADAVRFDRILVRGALGTDDPGTWLAGLATWLRPDGIIVLAEVDVSRSQRVSALVAWDEAEDLGAAVAEAERPLYESPEGWTKPRLLDVVRRAGATAATHHEIVLRSERRLPVREVDRWFGTSDDPGVYAVALKDRLDSERIADVARRYRSRVAGQVVEWRTVLGLVRASWS